ncbi:MAG: cytochrome c-type biogenesis protein CcmH [Actinobacteria bacterium]|nr:cytochrome c-type biogenesis protein CcmH [Actinomycetota bacterium]
MSGVPRSRRAVWALLLVVAVGTLVVAEVAERPPLTNADRAHQLSRDFACPVCSGQSVAESNVPIARTIRASIASMVDGGATDDDIRTMLVARFGEDIDYTPSGSGLTGLVWVLPVLAATTAVAGVVLAMRRWQGGDRGAPTRPFVLAGVGIVAVLAGVFVAQFSGSRGLGDTLSGDIRLSTRTLLIEAGVAPTDEAIDLYTQVLELQPSNAEALAYRGWAHRRSGDAVAARADLEAAVESDPTYPDARVFRASQRLVDGDANGAAQDLVALDALDAPPIVGDLLAATRLRERVATALIDGGGLVAALDLLDSGLAADPAAAGLLAERGWLLARTGEPELVEIGVVSLDEAVATDPLHPYALAYRSVVRSVLLGDSAGATADATEFASLPNQPPDLTALLESEGLLG